MARVPSLSVPPPPPPPPEPKIDAKKPNSRTGKRTVAFWVSEDAYEEFQVAVVRARTSIQTAGEQMLGYWMRQQGTKLPD